MALCPNCGAQQPEGAAFCDECGASLSGPQVSASPSFSAKPAPTVVAGNVCPTCGAQTSTQDPFCPNCGAALGEQAGTFSGQAHDNRTVVAAQAPQPQPPQQVSPSITCSNCGAQLEPDSAFCDMCGAPVTAQGAADHRTAVQGPGPQATQVADMTAPDNPWAQPSPQPQPPQPQQQVSVPQPRYQQPTPAPSAGRLVVQSTNVALPFPPGKTSILVGREDPVSGIFPDIDLTDHGGDEGGVSRQHARITMQGGQSYIEDLNSVNFTFVNQHKLTPNQPQALNDGDEIRLGRVKVIFRAG